MDKEWTRKFPTPPSVKPSDWYWYWEDIHDEEWIVEVWPGRDIKHYNGFWGPQIVGRPEEPTELKKLKKKITKAKEEIPPKPKRKKKIK